jgi:hypothetical protein
MIYAVVRWITFGPRANDCALDVCMLTTDKAKAEEFAKQHPEYSIAEVTDGEEYPRMG